MESFERNEMPDRALAAAYSLSQSLPPMTTKRTRQGDTSPPQLLAPTNYSDRLEYYQRSDAERGTFLYLGYGSNLSKETFRGNRGIKPLSQVNVQVPSLRLTFDLPGIPYKEPCFANTGRRDPDSDDRDSRNHTRDVSSEKLPLLPLQTRKDKYRKDRWHKGLIGVVYEVTPEDYAHIIQTEGGGSAYQDILVDCHPFAALDPEEPVPQTPTLPPFKAHTLFAPASDPDDPPEKGGRFQRPDPSYAQSSARYLKLMTDGAAELGLPYEYQDYLHSLRPYTVTSFKQRVGQAILLAIWGPIVTIIFALGKMVADEKGREPPWMVALSGAVFKAVWTSYDTVFKGTFGDGERTMSSDNGDEMELASGRSDGIVRIAEFGARLGRTDEEKV